MQEPELKQDWYIIITCEPDLFAVIDKDWDFEIEVNKTGTLVAAVYNEQGEEEEYETVTWSLNEEASTTIDNETGEITGSGEIELVTVTATLSNKNNIKYSVLIKLITGDWW